MAPDGELTVRVVEGGRSRKITIITTNYRGDYLVGRRRPRLGRGDRVTIFLHGSSHLVFRSHGENAVNGFEVEGIYGPNGTSVDFETEEIRVGRSGGVRLFLRGRAAELSRGRLVLTKDKKEAATPK